jgi:flagellar hook-associated protein 2
VSTSNNPISNLISISTFTGQSKFAADFQNVLSRAVQLQSLNLQTIQKQQQDESDRQSALQTLDSRFGNLQSAIDNLTVALGSGSYTGSVSNSAVASVSLSAGAQATSHTLEVTSLGSHAQAISSGSPAISNPNSQNITSGPIALSVGGGPAVQITPATNTLQGLVNAINGDNTLGVTASLVNVGNSGQPDYRLSLQATKLGQVAINLSEGTVDSQGNVSPGTSLVNTLVQGSLATYFVDGLSNNGTAQDGSQNPITSDSDTITLAPGVSVNLLQTNKGSPVTVNVAQSTAGIQTALQTFAAIYNNAVDQIGASHGQNANLLQGDGILFSASSALRSINGFSDGNGSGLSYLGLDLDKTGHLNFNSSEFQSTASQGVGAISKWLGDSTSGFIQAASAAVGSLENPGTGAIKNEEDQMSRTLTSLGKKISAEVDRINAFQQNLLSRLAQSDAIIYQLQSQASLFEGLFNNKNNNNNN